MATLREGDNKVGFRHLSDTENNDMSEDLSDGNRKILPWDGFSEWFNCFCVVTFDLELGQALEFIYPSHIKLTEKEKMNICYLSFPDSNSGCMGDTQFSFRIRRCPDKRNFIHSKRSTEYNKHCLPTLQIDAAHLYGYVYFRQVKDKTSRRGYFQKSLVLLSRLPFTSLFTQLASLVAPEYFDNGEPSIEAACHDIDQWPSPCPGKTLHLPIMGCVLQVRIPSRQDKPSAAAVAKGQVELMGSPLTVVPSISEPEMFRCLHPVIPHIQLLWELVLTGETLVVMAPGPGMCADTVHAMVSMISPLRFMCDFRPYFTIHDSEFKEYTTRTQAPPSVILGVTNPFFAKTLQHWPHIVRIGEPTYGDKNSKALKPKKPGSIKTLESKPGVYTQYKPFLNKDKSIIKRLAKGMQTRRPTEVQDAMLRRHLLELTQSFMIPLERYVASLMPLQRNISPWKHPPRLKPFDAEEFLKTLEHSGPQLTSGLKGDWVGLYKKFFRSKNFEGWFHQRQEEVNCKLSALHLETLCEADIADWAKDKQEVEVVDLLLKLREKMASVRDNSILVKPELIKQLGAHMDAIILNLPEDLQIVLQSH
ncbi:protein DENND6A-like [Lytechinus variegatus]|uniref:protein DENND6A-like n=1 Tax=Lytechinus variegatus TaxID=7654 RepID=UPI001BB0FB17|nr:protein DENND6A-like [Lytechinus variegatus]